MATDLHDFRAEAIELCAVQRCRCGGEIFAEYQARRDVILCPCERCGFIRVAQDFGAIGVMLDEPPYELWQELLREHGEEINAIKRRLAFGGDGSDAWIEPAWTPPPPLSWIGVLALGLVGLVIMAIEMGVVWR